MLIRPTFLLGFLITGSLGCTPAFQQILSSLLANVPTIPVTPAPTTSVTPAPTPAPNCKVVDPGPATGKSCIFPFTWAQTGKTYNGCAYEPSKGDKWPWCSTKVDANGNHVNGQGEWGKCDSTCPLATTTGTDDAIIKRVKGYIDSGTCGTVSCNSKTGSQATSYYKEFQYGGKRVIISSQVPDHPAEHDAQSPNPNVRCEAWQFIQLPLNPTKGSSIQSTGMGTVGHAITGGAFFNHLSDPSGKLAMYYEKTSLDSCNGHSAPDFGAGGPPGQGGQGGPPGLGGLGGILGGLFGRKLGINSEMRQNGQNAGRYHYHATIACANAGSATGAADPTKCLKIGYLRDGFPVYGYCRNSHGATLKSCYNLIAKVGETESSYQYAKTTNCHLDEANGGLHPVTGQYAYFMTENYPYTPIGYAGTQVNNICSAA